MRPRNMFALVVASLLGSSVQLLASRSLPAPPAGFELKPLTPSSQAMKDRGIADSIEAVQKDDSPCRSQEPVTFSYGWQLAPGADKTMELMAKMPQERASTVNGIRTEPAGQRRYKNGLPQWKKRTMELSTACSAGFVTYDGMWLGYVSGKLVSIGVSKVGSMETGQAWIDEYIDKVVAAAGDSKQ